MATLRPFGRGIPLSLVIMRYFAYVIVAVAAVWIGLFLTITIAINVGAVYPASYGAAQGDEVAAALRSAERFDPDAIPTAYRYVHLDAAGAVLETDLSDEDLESALRFARGRLGSEGGEEPAAVAGQSGVTYTVFELSDGTFCLLASEFLPQFTSRSLRDALPNPQTMMLVAACVGSVASILLISRRASRVIARKMAPLTDAADRIAREDLAFTVGASNVRQINDVLAAMERMRSSLKESLEARWRAERAQRDQVAALAHDLKTPLTVVRANADYVAEEMRDLAEANGAFRAEELEGVAAAASDAAAAAERLDSYVCLLIELSHGESLAGAKASVRLDSFAVDLEREAAALARAAGIELDVECDPGLAGVCIEADREAFGRAVMNIVANAFDHGRNRVWMKCALEGSAVFTVAVDDDGPGFSPEALEHGSERFFRGDVSRTSGASGTHYGIGLFTAAETARMYGGAVEFSNRVEASGRILGAHVAIRIPVSTAASHC